MTISNLSSGFRPGVCTSTTRPSAPYEGQLIYETDTDKVLVWNGSAWRFMSTPQTLEPGIYTDVSSTQTFSGFTKGNATIISRYCQIGKQVHFYGGVTLGSTSSMAGPLDVVLPVVSNNGVLHHPSSCYFYNNISAFWGTTINIATTSIRLVASNATGTYLYNNDIGSGVPFTWASTHTFFWNHTYEAA